MFNRSTCNYYIEYLTAGGELSESARIGLIEGLRTCFAMLPPTVTLIQRNITPLTAGSGFPHLVKFNNGALSAEDERCELQQYKTKMTRITVQLPDDEHGQPVLGSTLQEGGLELQLTLLNATTMQPLSDADNPRPQEGLFSGVAGRPFVPTARMDGSTLTFTFALMLLSSDIDGALIKIKVSRPNANAGDPLCVVTRAFKSRARSNVHEKKSNKRPCPPDINLNDFSGFDEVEDGLPLLSNTSDIDTDNDTDLASDIDTDNNFNDTDHTSDTDTDINLNDLSDHTSDTDTVIGLNDISVNDTDIDLNDSSDFLDKGELEEMLGAQPAKFLAAALSPADDAMVAEALANDEMVAAIEASEVEAAMAAPVCLGTRSGGRGQRPI